MILITLASAVFTFVILLRAWWVIEFRSHLADLMEEAYHDDLERSRNVNERYETWLAMLEAFNYYINKRLKVYNSVPSYLMLWKFWKPIDKFYTPEQMEVMTGAGY